MAYLEIEGQSIKVDLNNPLDISIPLRSGGNNPSCYHSSPPLFAPIEKGNFIGSVASGGPCNHQHLHLTPHGNGTHTECYGHLSDDPEATINKCLIRFHFTAELVSVEPTVNEHGDMIVNWSALENRINSRNPEALVIRTRPNNAQKLSKQYSGTNPPYLDKTAARELARLGILHLLIDLPSVDREKDDGHLAAHRAFWAFPENPRKNCTITELIFVPDSIPDGDYLLNLQIISLESDASPSKPVLYPIVNNS